MAKFSVSYNGKIIKTYELETQTIKEKIVTLEEKIVEVLARIEREGNLELRGTSSLRRGGSAGESGAATRADIILIFLAVLHLARDERVALKQGGIFSDIIVEKK